MSGKNTRGAWLNNPREARPGETIGGGFFVFRRGRETNRIRPSQWPFEHATLDAAVAQAQTHAAKEGMTYDVVQVVYHAEAPEAGPQADPA